MTLGDEADTKRLSEELIFPEIDGLKTVGVKRGTGESFLLVANLGSADAEFSASAVGCEIAVNVATGETVTAETLSPGEALLIRF